MTVNEMIQRLMAIPNESKETDVAICGCKLENDDVIEDFSIRIIEENDKVYLMIE